MTAEKKELVWVSMTGVVYHRKMHHPRAMYTGWTKEFAEKGMELRPCKVCWKAEGPPPEMIQ